MGTAAGTVGILYASGVINPTATKTNIKSIFNQDTTHWQSSGAQADSWRWNTDATPVTEQNVTVQDVQSWFLTFLNTYQSGNFGNVVNELSFTPSNNVGWNTVAVGVINNSRTYEGTFNLTYFRKTSAYANLATDLQNKTLDLSTGSDTVITNAVFLTKLKALSGNGNLNINAVVITKTSGGAIWNGSFGPEVENCLANFWSVNNDQYEGISIAPDTNNNYYGNSAPVTGIVLKLKRADLSAQTTWKSAWTDKNTFTVPPVATQVETRFDTAYTGQAWYTKMNSSTYNETWKFVLNNGVPIFCIKGNPFFSSQTVETYANAPALYQFPYATTQRVTVASQMINQSNGTISAIQFNMLPTPQSLRYDTYAVLNTIIKDSVRGNVAWNQLGITIEGSTGGKLTLTPVAGTVTYTTTAYQITWSLKS